MRWTHGFFGTIRGIVAVTIIIALFACGDLVAALQAATPPAQSTYRSTGAADPDEARRVVMYLGVGKHVMVKLSSGETVRGQIRGIADDHFVLRLEGSAAPADITYDDVRRLGPIPLQPVPQSRASTKRQIIIGAAAAVLLMWGSYEIQGCRHHSAC